MSERVNEARLAEMERLAQRWRDHDTLSLIDEVREHRASESRLAEMETEIADRADAEQHLMRDVADLSDRLAAITRALEGVAEMVYNDGTRCWCSKPPPTPDRDHKPYCLEARAILSSREA